MGADTFKKCNREAEKSRKSNQRWLGQLNHYVSIAGAHAMRPQFSMGLLLLLMIGTSLLLLRSRPAQPGTVSITERGTPMKQTEIPETRFTSPGLWGDFHLLTIPGSKPTDVESRASATTSAELPREKEPPQLAEETPSDSMKEGKSIADIPAHELNTPSEDTSSAPSQSATFRTAMDDFRAHRFLEAQKGFGMVAQEGGTDAGTAALYGARSLQALSGCSMAATVFDNIANRFAGTKVAVQAIQEAADCYQQLGQKERSKQLLQAIEQAKFHGYESDQERPKLSDNEKQIFRVARMNECLICSRNQPHGLF